MLNSNQTTTSLLINPIKRHSKSQIKLPVALFNQRDLAEQLAYQFGMADALDRQRIHSIKKAKTPLLSRPRSKTKITKDSLNTIVHKRLRSQISYDNIKHLQLPHKLLERKIFQKIILNNRSKEARDISHLKDSPVLKKNKFRQPISVKKMPRIQSVAEFKPYNNSITTIHNKMKSQNLFKKRNLQSISIFDDDEDIKNKLTVEQKGIKNIKMKERVQDWRYKGDIDRDGKTSLIKACIANNQFGVRQLLKNGANSNAKDFRGLTPVYYCVFNNSYKALVALLNASKDYINLSQKYGIQQKTVLHFAAQYADCQILQQLLQKRGCDPNVFDIHQRTPIFYSVFRNNLQGVGLFIDNGAALNLVDENKKQIFDYAIHRFYIDILRLLLKRGIKLGVNNIKGKQAMVSACKTGDFQTAKILVQRSVTVSTVDPGSGDTCLQIALAYGQIDFFCRILSFAKGEDINITDKEGLSLLTKAVLLGSIQSIKLILRIEGVDVNSHDKEGKTALMYASRQGHKEIVVLLIRSRVLLDEIDEQGNTALFYAVKNDHIDIVSFLIQRGASIFHKNLYKKLPINECKSQKCKRLLQKYTHRKNKFFNQAERLKIKMKNQKIGLA